MWPRTRIRERLLSKRVRDLEFNLLSVAVCRCQRLRAGSSTVASLALPRGGLPNRLPGVARSGRQVFRFGNRALAVSQIAQTAPERAGCFSFPSLGVQVHKSRRIGVAVELRGVKVGAPVFCDSACGASVQPQLTRAPRASVHHGDTGPHRA